MPTKVRVATDALDYAYNHDARTQSPRLSAARLQLAVCRLGHGPREQEEQRTLRASFVARYILRSISYESTHRAAAHRAGLRCFVEKNTTRSSLKRFGTSLRGQTRQSQ